MLRGFTAEAALLDADLAELRAASSHLSFQRFLSESMDGYVLRYLGILSAFTAMLPAVYHGVGQRANDDPTEYFLTCLHLLVNVGLALRDLVGSFKVAAQARGYATRVQTLYDAFDAVPLTAVDAPAPLAIGGVASAVLVLNGVSVTAGPTETPLVTNLSLAVQNGQRILVHGPNGVGKSSLLRALAGVWPLAAGEVTTRPPRDELVFVPQRAYVPERMSLRALLSYPHDAADDDATLLTVLKWAGLDGVVERGGAAGLDAAVGQLSGGEMQRVALARLRLRPPALAVLDEATANVEGAFEAKFFEWVKASKLTVLMVAHNLELRAHCTHELVLADNGTWQFNPL